MPTVASVRLRYSSQEYWFDPAGVDVQNGDHVVVETKRGTEIGLCTIAALDVEEADVANPLKPVLRVATEDDLQVADDMAAKGREAMPVFRELVEKHKLDMKPADVDFMFDGDHATFYFTADQRVDFRSLVRDLASEFHVRVDMRQIGARDEARMFGGFGHCGEELCCARIGGAFQPVSIRMAKEQDLSLNPSKISGLCGRLMCCLRYEFDTYKEFKGRSPKKGALIDTPLGLAKVVEFDMPHDAVRVRFEDGKSVNLPVSAMDTGGKEPKNGERIRPCHISQEKFDAIIEELHNDQTLAMMGDKLFSSDPGLADKTAEGGSISRNPHKRRSSSSKGSSSSRGGRGGSGAGQEKGRDQRKRRRSVSVGASGDASAQGEAKEKASDGAPRKRRRRRGGSGTGGGQRNAAQQPKREGGSSKPRPGQHSSTVSGDAASGKASDGKSGNGQRKRRRRRGGRGRGKGANGGSKPQNDGGSGKAGE